jgi:death-on-curing protein
MKYLSPELKKDFNRLMEQCTPVEGIAHPLINCEDVLRAYFILADYFTDESSGEEIERMFVGLRSEPLLASAITRQIVSFGGKNKYTDSIEICSTLFYGLVKNHAFLDGNKRVSLLILLYQLDLYGYVPKASEREFEQLVVSVAANNINSKILKKFKNNKMSKTDIEVQAIAYSLRRMVKKKDSSYHVKITARGLCDALKVAGVVVKQEAGKLKFRREIKKRRPFKPKVLQYSVVFGGWSRTIGAATAREVLEALELFGQYPSYQDFLDGSEPMYQLIQQFEGPLRRLKDE